MDRHPTSRELLIPISAALVTIFVAQIGYHKVIARRSKISTSTKEDIIEPPHVKSLVPYLGSAIEFSKNCKGFVQKWCKAFDNTPVFSALIAGKTYHFVTCTEYPVETIFRQKNLCFRPIAIDALTLAFGCSNETSKLFNYDFSKKFASIYNKHLLSSIGLKTITEVAQKNIAKSIPKLILQESEPFTPQKIPLLQLVQGVLFPATMHSVISSVLEGDEHLNDFIRFDTKFAMMMGGMPSWMCSDATSGRENLLKKILDEDQFKIYMSNFMKDRINAMDEMNINKEDGCRFNLSIVWGSVANTMPAAFWLLYYLLSDKGSGAYNAIQTEIDSIISKKKRPERGIDIEEFTQDELDSMISIDSALMEALRLQSESLIAREVTEDFIFDLKIPGCQKYYLRKGSRVVIYPSMLHYDDSVFESPQSFQWNRFLPDPSTGEKPKFYKNGRLIAQPVKPFGGGSSMCPGRKFAFNEIKVFTALLLSNFDLSLVTSNGISPPFPEIDSSRVGLGITIPVGDIPIEIRKRRL